MATSRLLVAINVVDSLGEPCRLCEEPPIDDRLSEVSHGLKFHNKVDISLRVGHFLGDDLVLNP